MEEEQKSNRGGRRKGAGRKKNPDGIGKQMYFRFRCTQKVFDIIHMHEDEGMSEWISKAVIEKQMREDWR